MHRGPWVDMALILNDQHCHFFVLLKKTSCLSPICWLISWINRVNSVLVANPRRHLTTKPARIKRSKGYHPNHCFLYRISGDGIVFFWLGLYSREFQDDLFIMMSDTWYLWKFGGRCHPVEPQRHSSCSNTPLPTPLPSNLETLVSCCNGGSGTGC